MAKQTFTTGQVLTAAQMTSLQQTAMGGGSATAKTASYTLVAADAGATVIMNSASATTITVNTSLFSAGDTVFLQNIGAGVCTITAGTATVNTASSLALAQYESGNLYFTAAGASIFSKADGAAAGGGSNFTLLNSGGTALSGSSTTVSGISGADKLFVRISTLSSDTAYADMTIRFNSDTGSNYTSTGYRNLPGTTYDVASICATTDATATSYTIGALGSNVASRANIVLMLQGGNSAGTKIIQSVTGVSQQGGIEAMPFIGGGLYAGSSTISSITVAISAGTFDQGTIFVFTSA